MTSFLGSNSYERGAERRGWRNGYKPRILKTCVGELELMVPKDCDCEFQTEMFERLPAQREGTGFRYVADVHRRHFDEIWPMARE